MDLQLEELQVSRWPTRLVIRKVIQSFIWISTTGVSSLSFGTTSTPSVPTTSGPELGIDVAISPVFWADLVESFMVTLAFGANSGVFFEFFGAFGAFFSCNALALTAFAFVRLGGIVYLQKVEF